MKGENVSQSQFAIQSQKPEKASNQRRPLKNRAELWFRREAIEWQLETDDDGRATVSASAAVGDQPSTNHLNGQRLRSDSPRP